MAQSRGVFFCLVWFSVGSAPMIRAADDADSDYTRRVRPILSKFCFECHGETTAKGKLRLDKLAVDFGNSKAAATWKEVMVRVADGADEPMPPKGKPRPSATEIKTLREWFAGKLTAAAAVDADAQKAEGRAQLRRLNRVEYNNTLHDLLGIVVDLKPLLPDDDIVAGFDNVGLGLQITRVHQERYLEAAEIALNAAIFQGPQPKFTTRRLNYRKADYPPRRMLENDAALFFTSASAELQSSRVPSAGRYRIRIAARPHNNPGTPMVMHVNCGNPSHPDEHYLAIAADKTTVVECIAQMGSGNTVRIAPYGLGVNYIRNLDTYDGPGMVIEWVEIQGPIWDTWPPESHQRLLGAVDLKKATLADAETVVRSLIARSFRRPVSKEKVNQFIAFLRARVETDKYTVEEALRQTLIAVLCAPDFLMLYETPGPLDDFAVASRLSYFLWRSMPDQPLLDLAGQKKLRSPEELRRQVDRMLKDPRAAALPEHFLGQWLGLRQIDATTPDKSLYPEFDDYLKYSMIREPQAFFDEMLRNDLPIQSFVDADFSMLNDRLAQHYGISGVVGPELRKVKLPPESHRGGVMTMAAVLKITANGTVTSPVLRGAWLQDRIMGQPLALPTDLTVPAVEPDIRGALNIRDQLAKHRTVSQCASCHQRMDPLGFALENFDPIGGYRTKYRALGKYPKANIKVFNKPVDYSDGLPVQAGDVLPGGKSFKDSDEFKKVVLADPAPVVRSVTEKLIIYATGSPIRPADRAAVDAIVNRLRHKNNGLRTLVYEIVQSELFLNK